MLPRTPRRQNLRQLIAHLRRGEVIAYATEGVWGIGCDPRRRKAMQRILAIKKRPQHKGVLMVAGHRKETTAYWQDEAVAPETLRQRWPGTTLVLPATTRVPFWIRGHRDTVAIRVSNHPGIGALCRAFGGAIVSTSANRAGRKPANNLRTLYRYFGPQLPVLRARLGRQHRPSRIMDARSGQILRE
ncbi:MAG: L-threonylcarbamoyladenylate synthase [Acidithiobacillus sp.]